MSVQGRVDLHVKGAHAAIVLNNPARRNAISSPMWESLLAHVESLSRRDDVRVVTFEGAGAYFSAGADISGFESERAGVSDAKAYDDLVERACEAVEAMPSPTLAVIRGTCIGAATSLAAACDVRICAEGSIFMAPAARLGLGYERRSIERIMRAFGGGAARQLLLTTEPMPAERAFALGAVHAVTAADRLQAHAASLVERIISNAPLSVRAAKLAIRSILEPRNEALRATAEEARGRADLSEDYREGRRAFADKRPPRFTGA